MLVQKPSTKELIYVASSLALLANTVISFLRSVKTGFRSVKSQGIFIILISGNPEFRTSYNLAA